MMPLPVGFQVLPAVAPPAPNRALGAAVIRLPLLAAANPTKVFMFVKARLPVPILATVTIETWPPEMTPEKAVFRLLLPIEMLT